ncbi:hypothetical protein B9Z19DRAFT_1100389 [Tuber borchii]|uniref:FAD-binding domain-containing protein n=1 Tax=Tuber borchii TaxID=42251 RepID=A0A2T6ZXI5_TUBBO|nr:hypothetical protein B9Z19DRAFT_1100389 [Tuber borchii]
MLGITTSGGYLQAKPHWNLYNSGTRPLRILTNGTGIGGLTAAILLRRASHSVIVIPLTTAYSIYLFEKSLFLKEPGAAIRLRLGLIAEHKLDGSLVFEIDASQIADRYPHEITIVEEERGAPVTIDASSRAVDVDFEKNTPIQENGEMDNGDSTLRPAVTGENNLAAPIGKSAFRFLLLVNGIPADPVIAQITAKTGRLQVYMVKNKRAVTYPYQYSLLLNFVCPSQDASKTEIVGMFKDFYPPVIALLPKVPANEIKFWQILDLLALPRWVKGNVTLTGRAAHPVITADQRQGCVQAIQDCAALAAVLPLGTKKEDAVDRPKLYQEFRYERATRVQDATRIRGMDSTGSKKTQL